MQQCVPSARVYLEGMARCRSPVRMGGIVACHEHEAGPQIGAVENAHAEHNRKRYAARKTFTIATSVAMSGALTAAVFAENSRLRVAQGYSDVADGRRLRHGPVNRRRTLIACGARSGVGEQRTR